MGIKRIRFIVFAFSILLLAWMLYNHFSARYYIQEIKREIRGVVLNKYNTGHGEFIKISLYNGNILDIPQKNSFLYSYLRKGDEFFKQTNDNYCLIVRNGETKKFIFVLIPPKARNSFDWPKEWKYKWMDATEEWKKE
ncbi:hypothetical protein [Chryseobacterium sp. SIMBA_029]|uniref:hypothetical protein n=1 Tax=Chryseobacterium sp. SIMBA_029 TaxID=3085772 RepID=UPI00397E21F6